MLKYLSFSNYFNRQFVFSTLRNDDFDFISDCIIETLPGECKETYYVPPIFKKNSTTNKSKVSKGKLVDKYRNKLTFLRKGNISRVDYASKDVEDYEISQTEGIFQIIQKPIFKH